MSDSEQAADPMLGRRFGSYVVEEKLGEGGMGAVYRAIQPEIGKQVAIKFLAPHLSQNPNVVQRFFAEARSVNLIQHDNIVDIFDFGQMDGLSFFVMELMKGLSLEAVLQQMGRLSVGRAVDIALQVADAIAAAHARNIIHRDLKPDNIFLVTRTGRVDFVKLLDFGIAKLAGGDGGGGPMSRTMAGAVLGTPGYMSPEQGTGGAVDGRTDVYALGVILYRMLSGRLPFEGNTFPEILQKQLIEPPPNLRVLRAELPPPLAQLVHQMIAREVGDRPQTMAQVTERLAPMMPAGHVPGGREPSQRMGAATPSSNHDAVGVGPSSIPGNTTLSGATGQRAASSPGTFGDAQPRKKPTMVIAIAAGLIAVAGGVALFGMGSKKSEDPHTPATQPTVTAPDPAPRTPTSAPAPTPTPTSPTPATPKSGFAVYIETDPPGAQMLVAGKLMGTTPGRVELKGDSATMKLHLSGYRDEGLELSPDVEHQVVRLHKESGHHETAPAPAPTHATRPLPPPPVPAHPTAPKPKKPAIGLDD